MKTTIYLTRHGETQWNVEKRMQGWQDSPLTELGTQQAAWLRDALQAIHFETIYSSPSSRASQTAEILRGQRACEVVHHEDLREIFMGNWEGQTQQDIQLKDAASYTAFWENPHLYIPANGGESFYDVQQRVWPLLKSVIEEQSGKTLLIVTHTVALKIMMSYFERRPLADLWQPPYIHPTALCKVVIEDQQTSIELAGDISHYPA